MCGNAGLGVTRRCSCPQGCFDQRIRAWQRWQESQSTLQKKREAEAKLLWANKPDKLQQAKEEITEVRRCSTELSLELLVEDSEDVTGLFLVVSRPQWESKVTQYERDFDRVGMTVRKEFLRFEVRKDLFKEHSSVPVIKQHLNP